MDCSSSEECNNSRCHHPVLPVGSAHTGWQKGPALLGNWENVALMPVSQQGLNNDKGDDGHGAMFESIRQEGAWLLQQQGWEDLILFFFLLGRWVFLSLFTCQSSPHVRALLLRETSSDIYTPTNKLVQ